MAPHLHPKSHMQRSILALSGILLLVTAGAFFSYVSILSIMAVAVLLMAMMLMFFLGIQTAKQEILVPATPAGRKLHLVRVPGHRMWEKSGTFEPVKYASVERQTQGFRSPAAPVPHPSGSEIHVQPDKDLRCLDGLIADLGGSDTSTHSIGLHGLLIEHLQAARRNRMGSRLAEYGLSLEQAKGSLSVISDGRMRTKAKENVRSLLDSKAPRRQPG